MTPAAFDYLKARSLNHALKALDQNEDAKVIAGGQSLLPLLRLRLARPQTLIDIGHLPKLKGTRRGRGGIRIGGATTYRDITEDALLKGRLPLLPEAAGRLADIQVRNLGTIGGGLAHADPAADMAAVMLALDATFTLESTQGKRQVPATEFFKGPFETALNENELLTEIFVPLQRRKLGMAYVKFKQAASGFALAGAAAVIARSRKTIVEASLAFTGITETPFRSPAADALEDTKGKGFEELAAAAVQGIEAGDDIHAPAAYRTQLAKVAAQRALQEAYDRAG